MLERCEKDRNEANFMLIIFNRAATFLFFPSPTEQGLLANVRPFRDKLGYFDVIFKNGA